MPKNSEPQDTALQVTVDSYNAAVYTIQNSAAYTADQKHALCVALFDLCHQPSPSPADGEQSNDQANESDQSEQ